MPVSSQGQVGKGGFPDGRGPETDLKEKKLSLPKTSQARTAGL